MPPPTPRNHAGATSSSSPKWTDDPWGCRFIFAYIIACAAAGFAFVLPGISNEDVRYTLFAVQSVLVLSSITLLFVIHKIDPGIIPPSSTKDPEIVEAESGQLSTDLVIDSHGQWARRRLLLDGRSEITQRYCNTCNIWREARTSHCSRCGYCMERFDHHCGAVGVCIARKNHRFFTTFLFTSAAASAIFLYACISRLQKLNWSRGLSNQSASTFGLLLLGLVYFYSSLLGFFAVMHCTILLCDCTTKQYIQRSRQGRAFEWQQLSLRSWLENMRNVCCADVKSKTHIAAFDSMNRERLPETTV